MLFDKFIGTIIYSSIHFKQISKLLIKFEFFYLDEMFGQEKKKNFSFF